MIISVNDYHKYCLQCKWYDGMGDCTLLKDKYIEHCRMYRHYHPQEVREYETKVRNKYAKN